MSSKLIVIDEPELQFRHEQMMHDPHDGLALFGPYDRDMPSHPDVITYGVIGTGSGISKFQIWRDIIQKPIVPEKKYDPRLWPAYPGFEAVFDARLPNPAWEYELDDHSLLESARNLDKYQRTYHVVDHYLKAFEVARKRDENFSLMICVVPDEVFQNCRPQSYIPKSEGVGISLKNREIRMRKSGQRDLFSSYDPEQYHLSVDFRRQLKARTMKYKIPLQIIRESTLRVFDTEDRKERGLTPLADRAWNLSTTMYYKAGGKPWRLSTAREGVCYIGISFKKTDDKHPRTACCAAQMFLDSGDGVVFLGEYGPWYSPEDNQFHLSKQASHDLLEGVLKTYRELEGKEMKEVFLHSRSTINNNEFEGFKSACKDKVKLVGIRVAQERRGLRLYRMEKRPVLRGTCLCVNKKTAYLWASGFKPNLGTYDGWEVPVPLRIDIQHGDADIRNVAKDIYGLTKLNYNTCKLGEGEPITIGFSDSVGEILVSNPTVKERSPSFKYYI